MDHKNGELIFDLRERELSGFPSVMPDGYAEEAMDFVQEKITLLHESGLNIQMSPFHADKARAAQYFADTGYLCATFNQLKAVCLKQAKSLEEELEVISRYRNSP